MAENGTIFKTRTYDFFVPFNEPKQLPKSKCAYIEDHARMLPAPGVQIKSCKSQLKLGKIS